MEAEEKMDIMDLWMLPWWPWRWPVVEQRAEVPVVGSAAHDAVCEQLQEVDDPPRPRAQMQQASLSSGEAAQAAVPELLYIHGVALLEARRKKLVRAEESKGTAAATPPRRPPPCTPPPQGVAGLGDEPDRRRADPPPPTDPPPPLTYLWPGE